MNPRDPFGPNGFQDRRFQPLTHSSASNYNVFRELAANLCQLRLYRPRFAADCSRIVTVVFEFCYGLLLRIQIRMQITHRYDNGRMP